MDENLKQATEDFFTLRINYHGENETEVVNGAYMELRSHAERLCETLSEEQMLLFRKCENAFRLSDGEIARFYYKSGFSDAIRFLHQFGEAN